MAFRREIPTDWDTENGDWEIAVFCYPNSPEWRRIITGHISALKWGMGWKDAPGLIPPTQAIASLIFESLCMDCKTVFERIATATERIADTLEGQVGQPSLPATTNDVLDQIADGSGVSVPWNLIKVGLAALFPEAAIPIGIGLSVIEFLVSNSNSTESEVFEIAKILGSTALLPD